MKTTQRHTHEPNTWTSTYPSTHTGKHTRTNQYTKTSDGGFSRLLWPHLVLLLPQDDHDGHAVRRLQKASTFFFFFNFK